MALEKELFDSKNIPPKDQPNRMRVICIIQARMGSSRLPGKIMKEVQGRSLLEIQLERIAKAKRIDQIILATTTNASDQQLVDFGHRLAIDVYRGSENDVLDRYYQAASSHPSDYVVRLTSDCPLVDPQLIDEVIAHTLQAKADYGANILQHGFPDGQDIEVFRFSALETAWKEATLTSEREHVTPFLINNTDYKGGTKFTGINFDPPSNYGHLRMTVDEPADFDVMSKLIEDLGTDMDWTTYADYLIEHPEVSGLNQSIERNEGYQKSLDND